MLLLILIAPHKLYATTDKFDVSGFARIVGGYLDEEFAEYQGYDDSLTFSSDSLLGVKAEYRHDDELSIVAQGVFTESDIRKSGFDWLYISYKPNVNWQLDFGRYRTPLFEYSEVTDVGFAYPWVIPPQTTYVNGFFSSINGARATYLFNANNLNFSVSAVGGHFDSSVLDRDSSTVAKTDLMSGINIRLDAGNFKSRIGFITGDFDVDINGLTDLQNNLKLFDFNKTAEALEINGRINIYQMSASYETLNYFALTEATLIKGESKLLPVIESYYVTLGLFYDNLSYYVSASKLRTTNPAIKNNVPQGIAPQLNILSSTVDAIINARLQDDVDIATVGIRWDIKSTLAFKAEIDMIDGKTGQRSTFSSVNKSTFDRYATLYLFSVDWLF